MGERILVVEDEPSTLAGLCGLLADEGYEVDQAVNGEEALEKLGGFGPSAVLTDLRMPKLDGIGLLRKAREQGSDAVFVVMTACGSVQLAVEAMGEGAESYLLKPFDPEALSIVLHRALEKRRLQFEAQNLRERESTPHRFHQIVGESAGMQRVFGAVKEAASTHAAVLIQGESGTGKDLVAQAIHEASPRSEQPFVKVNCAAREGRWLEGELFGRGRDEGRLRLAEGGTLLLDEVGELSPSLQPELLQLFQQGTFERSGGAETLQADVRVLAATNRNLAAEVKAGRFRDDLLHRLAATTVTLPPLRQRTGDIPALVDHFLDRYCKAYGKNINGLAPGTLGTLLAHPWPGNVRELENVIERAVVLGKRRQVTPDDLPAALRCPRPDQCPPGGCRTLIPGATLYEIEREAILRTLEMVDGSTARAGEVLGISVRKIQYRLKEYACGKPCAPGDHRTHH